MPPTAVFFGLQARPFMRRSVLGSGGGIDCFLAARQVGEGGKVIGVDMTAEMIERSRQPHRSHITDYWLLITKSMIHPDQALLFGVQAQAFDAIRLDRIEQFRIFTRAVGRSVLSHDVDCAARCAAGDDVYAIAASRKIVRHDKVAHQHAAGGYAG